MYRDTIFQYVKKQYGTIPEYLWNDLPDSVHIPQKQSTRSA